MELFYMYRGFIFQPRKRTHHAFLVVQIVLNVGQFCLKLVENGVIVY